MLKNLTLIQRMLYLCFVNITKMKYTEKQIENAKRSYNAMLRIRTLVDYDVETIGMNTAYQRMEFHNNIVRIIKSGNKEIAREWKLFFLTEEVKRDQKEEESKTKKAANKAASADILEPVKKLRKLGEFGQWLNTTGNPYRKQHFSKKYTVEAVNEFLNTL